MIGGAEIQEKVATIDGKCCTSRKKVAVVDGVFFKFHKFVLILWSVFDVAVE